LGGRKGIQPVKNMVGDGGGGHWLVRMEWCPAGWSVCLPLLISPFTIKSRSSLLAPAHPGGPGKRAIKWLWCGGKKIKPIKPLVEHRPHLPDWVIEPVITGSIARSANLPVFSLLRGRF